MKLSVDLQSPKPHIAWPMLVVSLVAITVFGVILFRLIQAENDLAPFAPIVLVLPLAQAAVALHTFHSMMQRVSITTTEIAFESPLRSRKISREDVASVRVSWMTRSPKWLDADGRAVVVTRAGRRVLFLFRRPDIDRDGELAQAWPSLLRAGPPL